jgi:hypothetical protein
VAGGPTHNASDIVPGLAVLLVNVCICPLAVVTSHTHAAGRQSGMQ